MSTVAELIRTGSGLLSEAGVPDPEWDAETLLAEVLRLSRLEMKMEKRRLVSPADEAAFWGLLRRRQAREPLQYILGTQCFMGLELKTDPRALIPRFDTEALCEAACAVIRPGMTVLDLCTGTGALALAVKSRFPDACVSASDISADALALARENAEKLALPVRFLQGDLWDAVGIERFDVILSNPPYIPEPERDTLQKEVRFEPELALFGGTDGLSFYRRIASGAPLHLTPHGKLFLEIGDGEADAVTELLRQSFTDIRCLNDLGGLQRVIAARLKGDTK